MADLYQEITEFGGGVQSAGPSDRIPLNSTPLAINTAFRNIGSGMANLGCRPGLVGANATPFTDSPSVLFQRLYNYDNAGTFTNYLATLTSDGKLRYKDEANAYTAALAPPANFPAPSSLCFTAASNLIDATVMSNRLFLLNDAGEKRSLLDQDYKPWGLSPLATWTAAGAATGANSMPDETYDVSISTYDDDTGGESGLSTPVLAVAIGGANRRIKVDITPTAAETAQYPYWRVYLRRQATQAELYQVQTLYDAAGSSITTDGKVPIGTLTAYIDASSTTIANLTTSGPTDGSRGLPPSGAKYVATYGRRLMLADGRNVYWSNLDQPDAFDPLNYEPIDTGEGDAVTGISPFSDELLLIFTTSALWGLFGNDPQTWTLKPIDYTIGCASHLSIVEFDGKVAWWSQTEGPVIFDGTSITRAGLDLLGRQAVVTDIEASRLAYVYGGQDPQGSRVMWSVPLSGNTTRNTRIIPYNYRIKQFEASYWNPMDICSFSVGFLDGVQFLFAGNYAGQVFYFDADTQSDGIETGTTHSFTFVASGITASSLTSTGFSTTGGGLVDRYVLVVDSDYAPVSKVRISANTATTLTLATAVRPLTIGATYTAYVGSPDFRLYTKWMDMDQTFIRKRFDRAYFQIDALGAAGDARVATQINFAEEDLPTTNIVPALGNAIWDTAVWDVNKWSGEGVIKKRVPILRTGQGIRLSVFHFGPNQDVVVRTIGVLARATADRYYA